ncbi:ELMO/CED-12 family protein [Cryomyces antarcticus]|uniref:ELMO domain-containing protein n=1 Tax=Cryomyces antarcticus TaxID=329879 RepID=A0ABR0KUI7_9PEZI|nr:hypothetical protein LTR39_001822 [Cryomyces antarcticus]KAK5020671.1 hypothetical protein LTR60_000315 [Cryomyces antarcticus]KAK5131664.1 hypothetical protein LTR16_000547 [Cryomyces antarcticus]
MENIDVRDLVQRLGEDEDMARKKAAFMLQSAIGDPSFADVFIQQGGMPKLRFLALQSTGNTLAYTLASFSRLLELDMGWEYVSRELIERAVELVVSQPLVNILRASMSVLVAIVSHPHNPSSQPGPFGFRALKPSISGHPQFLEILVGKLSAADHALCANALQLINALMRDAITSDTEIEWPKFIKKLQDLGVIKAVYILMQSTALQDLAHPVLEFQSLSKVLLRKWKDVKVDLEKSEHRRALKGLHLASNPDRQKKTDKDGVEGSRKHHPKKWRRLGFETESPAWEFDDVGFLGMMDLTDYVRKSEDGYQRILLEQSTRPFEQRCPLARASLSVTLILYEHFEVDKSDSEEFERYTALESRSDVDKVFRPQLLQWSRLHTGGVNAFLRLWKATGAEHEDFQKIEELVRILIEQVVGQAPRTKDIGEVEEELADFDYHRLRDLQMELLELTYEDAWGQHLRQVRDELDHEALQFVKEQRVRCLLQGAWFPNIPDYNSDGGTVANQNIKSTVLSWKYVRLSHNRRFLHYRDYDSKGEQEPVLDELRERIDLSIVSSVVSNVSASDSSTTETMPASTYTRIVIYGSVFGSGSNSGKENVLLQLHPQSHTLASEWLDGLLLLLNQQPITSDTSKLIQMISGYGLKIRLLNLSFNDLGEGEAPEVPSREGLDEDYWFDMGTV